MTQVPDETRVERVLPVPVRRVLAFDLQGMVSLWLLVTRRRHGVPTGATAVPYTREQLPTFLLFLLVMVVETVAFEVLLRGIGAPAGLRHAVLFVDLYGILFGLAVGAGYVTRPHVITADELRIRSGAFFDLRVPREQIATVRFVRNFNESGMIKLVDGRLSVAVVSQTNVVVELTEPITVTRPLGRRGQAQVIRFFTDTPDVAVDALRAAAPDV